MSKTIKELAEELGLSKTAIRKYLTPDFREKFVETTANGVLLVSDEGANHIANQCKGLRKPVETTANQFAETTANQPQTTANQAQTSGNQFAETTANQVSDDIIKVLQETIDVLKTQLEIKDKQIEDLTEANKHLAQSINAERQNELAGTMQQFLPGESSVGSESSEKETGFWAKLFGRRKK